MKSILASIVSVFALSGSPPAATTMSQFQLTVNRSANGWQMHCATGCAWSDLSLECPGGCKARVDSAGITTDIGAKEPSHGFAFVIEATSRGWSATGLVGTLWSKVTWGCLMTKCETHLNGRGVGGA